MSSTSCETLRVCLRLRPNACVDVKDSVPLEAPSVSVLNANTVSLHRPFMADATFKGFHSVLHDASQHDTYEESARSVVQACMEGLDGAVLAYGVTGAGKSHSVWGPRELYEDELRWQAMLAAKTGADLPEDAGLLPRAMHHIFEHLAAAQASRGMRAQVCISMVQLYNEGLYDMCDGKGVRTPRGGGGGGFGSTPAAAAATLTLREDASSRPHIPDAISTPVASPQQALACLRSGITSRFTAATACNDTSSRSHAVVQINIKQLQPIGPSGSPDSTTSTSGSGGGRVECTTTESCLCVVDLAGSERLKRARVTAEVVKEAASINKSIFCLGAVVHALAERHATEGFLDSVRTPAAASLRSSSTSATVSNSSGTTHSNGLARRGSGSSLSSVGSSGSYESVTSGTRTHIPFRNSILTRILRPSLDGSTNTCILACLSQSSHAADETYGTLQFAQRAVAVPTKPKRTRVAVESKSCEDLECARVIAHESTSHVTAPPSLLARALGSYNNGTDHVSRRGVCISSEPGAGRSTSAAVVCTQHAQRPPLPLLLATGSIGGSTTACSTSTVDRRVRSHGVAEFLGKVHGSSCGAALSEPSLGAVDEEQGGSSQQQAPLSPSTKASAEFSTTLHTLREAAVQRRAALTQLRAQVNELLTER